MGHHLVETDVLDSINSTQLLSLQLRKNICEIPGFADVWWIFSMGDPPLVESLGNRNIWLVVWNILNFPFHIWENPSHWLSYCSRWFFNHQPDMHTFFFYLRGFLDRISPQKMRWFGACETIARATQGRCSRGGLHAVVFAAGATVRSDLGNLEKSEDLIGNSWWWNRSKS